MDFNNNICFSVPYRKDAGPLQTINLVYETEHQSFGELKTESVYKMYYVCSGTGYIHTSSGATELNVGDVFFTFPGEEFCLETKEDFSYMYSSFLGTKGNMLLDMLQIDSDNFLFKGCKELGPVWKNGFKFLSVVSDLASESLLLYSFAYLGNRLLSENSDDNNLDNTVINIKKYIDDHFCESDLSLDSISKDLSYNKKYISTVFKKKFKIGVVKYLNTIRIQYACTLIQQGHTSVNNISRLCGYSDAHYFSKVFKDKMACSPKEYVEQFLQKERKGKDKQ